jgi:pimeloyl-ACP methyl ester carboxylesterase
MASDILRGFVEIEEGQVHYRRSRTTDADSLPLIMLHASPGSSRMLTGMIALMGRSRRVIATDTLGNGDSAAPRQTAPTIADFADAHLRALDALGVERFDLYGTHTGGCIACEIAIRHPDRVRRLILDGMSLYSAEERADMLENYALEIRPDLGGGHLTFAWHFVRDNYLFWPWYKRDAAHVRAVGLPSPDVLHDKLVEVLKACRTYHLSYRAAIAYRKEERLPLLRTPTLLVCAGNDMLLPYLAGVAKLVPGALVRQTPGVANQALAEETAAVMTGFLDQS